ncbi:MAG: hypothetical protein MZV65_25610 [Chromatiales bacterium]|nr:hypothetical protein [Chromatiales bacterium]
MSLVDKRAWLLPLDARPAAHLRSHTAFIRDAYSQRRLFQVYDGDVPEELLPQDEQEFEDDAGGRAEGRGSRAPRLSRD